MTPPEQHLLCIAPAGAAIAACVAEAAPGWQLRIVRNCAEAERALRLNDYRVGVLAGLGPAFDHAGLERFLALYWRMRWIALADAGIACHQPWRALVRDLLFDFHTLPADPQRLGLTLGHALGMAMLSDPMPAAGLAATGAGNALKGQGAAIMRLRKQVARVAQSGAPVLIWGESGAGKEVTAQAVHAQSPRSAGPFVPVNCGAMAPTLIHAELFGHARGAFTGAARDRPGLIESAAGGSIFLDEIADLPRDLQANLLRFLQERTIYRVGSTKSIEVDVRVIAASNVNLRQAVANGEFREDLYYRLNVLPITVPPLRERREDLPLLAEHFFRVYAAERPRQLRGFSSAAMRAMQLHGWPGNVRELINRIRRALVLAEGRQIMPEDLELPAEAGACEARSGDGLDASRSAAERAAIDASLQRSGSNVTVAARELGISRMTLYRLMSRHGIGNAKLRT